MKTLKHALFGLTVALALTLTSGSRAADIPKVGDKAPMVQGKDQDGKDWSLSDSIGKRGTLIYFYPKDDTPGCTKEACGLRDRMADFKKQNLDVVGVSFDSAESHKAFIAKHQLNFPLLADTDGKIADAFGVKNKERKTARRVSFLIDKDGKIVHVTDSPSADVHLAEMEQAAAKLAKK